MRERRTVAREQLTSIAFPWAEVLAGPRTPRTSLASLRLHLRLFSVLHSSVTFLHIGRISKKWSFSMILIKVDIILFVLISFWVLQFRNHEKRRFIVLFKKIMTAMFYVRKFLNWILKSKNLCFVTLLGVRHQIFTENRGCARVMKAAQHSQFLSYIIHLNFRK